MPAHDDTDERLFSSLPGGRALVDWFGFCPRFHDARLDRLEVAAGQAALTLRAFRMTSEVDKDGYFVLDRHALVTLRMTGVTGLRMEGGAGSVISELIVRRLDADTPSPTGRPALGR